MSLLAEELPLEPFLEGVLGFGGYVPTLTQNFFLLVQCEFA